MSDRRKTSRFKSQNQVRIHRDLDPERELTLEEFEARGPAEVETLDLSAGGCQLFSLTEVPLQQVLTFAVRLDDHIITIRGRAVRSRQTKHEGRVGWRLGIEFLDLEPMVRDGITLYLLESGADPAADPAAPPS